MNAGTKPNALEGIGVLAERESLLELSLMLLKRHWDVEVDLQACGAVGLLGIFNFAFDFVTKLGRN